MVFGSMKEYEEEAKNWIDSLGNVFTLCNVDENAKQLTLAINNSAQSNKSSGVTFKITVSNSDSNTVNFTVESDDENTNLKLYEVNDSLMSKKEKSLSQVLNMVHNVLCEDNENEDDDDYYEVDSDLYSSEDDLVDEVPTPNPHTSTKVLYGKDDTVMNAKSNIYKRSPMAVARILSDFKQLKKSACNNFGISGGPRGDNLFLWDVQLTDFDKQSRLGVDLDRYARRYNEEPVLKLEMKFPQTYPMEPPFLRVVKPRFEFLTGHVTIGGSICMELLTKSGWSPSNDIESILVQVRAEIMSDSNARLHKNPNQEYSEQDAINAFRRMTMKYGWN